MLLEALFEGNIYPSETIECTNEKCREAKKTAGETMNYFEQILSEQDYDRMETMLDDLATAQSEENGEHFKTGFVMGMRLMQEIYAYPVLPNES